ncbi:MAG: hypothetical protein F4Z09_06400 [Rhodobacteraceae bacterium]|nr:hypothetical protein [Paracoccaceae bacterium]
MNTVGASPNTSDTFNVIVPLSKPFSSSMFPAIGNAPSLWSKNTVAVFPTLPRKATIPHASDPGGWKTNKIGMDVERIRPEKVENTNFGLVYSKILHNRKITP